MYIYIYIYLDIYVHMYIYIYIYLLLYIYMYTYVHTYMAQHKRDQKNVALLQVRLFIWLCYRWDSHMAVLQMGKIQIWFFCK